MIYLRDHEIREFSQEKSKESIYRELLSTRERTLGPDNYAVARVLNNIADLDARRIGLRGYRRPRRDQLRGLDGRRACSRYDESGEQAERETPPRKSDRSSRSALCCQHCDGPANVSVFHVTPHS